MRRFKGFCRLGSSRRITRLGFLIIPDRDHLGTSIKIISQRQLEYAAPIVGGKEADETRNFPK